MHANLCALVGVASLLWGCHHDNRRHGRCVALNGHADVLARGTKAVIHSPSLKDLTTVTMKADVNVGVVVWYALAKLVNVLVAHALNFSPKASLVLLPLVLYVVHDFKYCHIFSSVFCKDRRKSPHVVCVRTLKALSRHEIGHRVGRSCPAWYSCPPNEKDGHTGEKMQSLRINSL